MLNVAATVVYRRGRVSSDGAAHSGSIKPRRPFQSGTVRVASANLAPTGVIWHLFRKRVSQAGERSEWPVTHPQSPDRGLLPVSPLSDRNDEKGVAQQGRSCFSLRFFERPSTLGIAAAMRCRKSMQVTRAVALPWDRCEMLGTQARRHPGTRRRTELPQRPAERLDHYA